MAEKIKLSEIKAHYEGMVAKDPAAFYLLDLVERMGSTLEHAIKCGYFPLMLAEEARALLEELKK